ncbi:hypothetical protein SK3146_03383 [Paenibacillus konkukensis]|uniref:Uncharacterized protein n=1 Tax=Paenibacillus konkukensis TaxID=2020716 RepID=A0ABY4RPM8_9BACL|nr:hypothetical protein [Paenibacillus konkukensis]UQZ84150.1 hypothetical protein SK3146_03383 [Paenibacillus konkukensis]
MTKNRSVDAQAAVSSQAEREAADRAARGQANAAREKQLEDRLHISEDKVVDYTPGID